MVLSDESNLFFAFLGYRTARRLAYVPATSNLTGSHVVLSVGHILFEFYSQDRFCPCNTVVVFEMYSLIGSLVIMNDCKIGALTGTFARTSRFKYGCLGAKWACIFDLRAFRSHIHPSHVFHLSSASRSLILDVPTCNGICRRHDVPMNGPMGDPSMVILA